MNSNDKLKLIEKNIYEMENDRFGKVSDGYHTFDELYHHRTLLFLCLALENSNISWKSKFHDDGTMYDDMFIAGITTPDGQATYHCDMKYWDMFDVVELERAPKFDGHTPDDAIKRIVKFISSIYSS